MGSKPLTINYNCRQIRLRKKYAVHCATSPEIGIEVRHYLVFKDQTRTGVNAPYSQKAVGLSTGAQRQRAQRPKPYERRILTWVPRSESA
jgi:hypothetical protein